MKKALKIAGIVLGSLIVIAAGLFGTAVVSNGKRFDKKYEITDNSVTVPTDAASIERGKHLANSLGGCTHCHAEDLGGRIEADIPGLLTIRTPNITQGEGSVVKGYTDEDWVRALRHGVKRDGTPMFIMPSGPLNKLTAEDLGSIIAAVKTFPPVDRQNEKWSIGPIGQMLFFFDQIQFIPAEEIDHTVPAAKAVSWSTEKDLGKYLASTGGCVDCHRADLSGGRIPGTPSSIPPAANLTSAGPIAKYSDADFVSLFRTGKRPDGSTLHEIMPWKSIGQLKDEELRALYTYLHGLPPLQTKE